MESIIIIFMLLFVIMVLCGYYHTTFKSTTNSYTICHKEFCFDKIKLMFGKEFEFIKDGDKVNFPVINNYTEFKIVFNTMIKSYNKRDNEIKYINNKLFSILNWIYYGQQLNIIPEEYRQTIYRELLIDVVKHLNNLEDSILNKEDSELYINIYKLINPLLKKNKDIDFKVNKYLSGTVVDLTEDIKLI